MSRSGDAGTGDVLIKEIFIDATPEEIFPYLTEPKYYTRWMGIAAEMDPRPGGQYRIDLNGIDWIEGEYRLVEPPYRLVYTWSCTAGDRAPDRDLSVVEIELIPKGTGTLLRLTHRGPDREGRDRHEGGWAHYLDRLMALLRGQDPGRDSLADPRRRHTPPESAG
jgi:uncharacterized protein YndB with AHSA1/START domain